MSKSLKYGSHDFPTSAGFTGSSGKVAAISPYTRRVPKSVTGTAGPKGRFASAAAPVMGPAPMRKMKPGPTVPAQLGHSTTHRARPITQEDALHGGTTPLLTGFKRGGKVSKR